MTAGRSAIALFCIVLAYFGLLRIARTFFGGPFRAQAAVIAVLTAFVIGFALPDPKAPPASLTAPAAGLVPPPSAPQVQAPADVGSSCLAARLSGTGGTGHLDTAQVRGGSGAVRSAAGATLLHGQSVILNGWAARSDLKQPAKAACLVIDGKIVAGVKALYGTNRPDVGTAYRNSGLNDTGFAITLPAALVSAGPHTVAVASVAADSSAALLSGEVHLSGPDSGHR